MIDGSRVKMCSFNSGLGEAGEVCPICLALRHSVLTVSSGVAVCCLVLEFVSEWQWECSRDGELFARQNGRVSAPNGLA